MSSERIIPERELNEMIDKAAKEALHSNLTLQAFRSNMKNQIKEIYQLPAEMQEDAYAQLMVEEHELEEANEEKQAYLEGLHQYHWEYYLGPLYELYSKMK